ncbi:MAG: FAD-dependent oxidoreductase [Anaerolineae bacterium]|nr:FAD-dependent oxidoreductase [Anaerolineae bacterium]
MDSEIERETPPPLREENAEAQAGETAARFNAGQLEELTPYARVREVADGETLFAAGDTNAAFYVVRDGKVTVFDSSRGKRRILAEHGPGEFTGDITVLTGRATAVTAVAEGRTVVYEISRDKLRQLVNEQPELGDAILQVLLARRDWLEAAGLAGVTVLGSRYSPDTLRVRDFLSKNQVPFNWIDVEKNRRVQRLFDRFHVTPEETPVVALRGQGIFKNPSNRELGELLNITQPVDQTVYDLIIIGAGPAGLAAAVYGASEGLKTAVIEESAPGGQASKSSKIENYMGFPTGLSGSDLAERAVIQAQKFGATLTAPVKVVGLRFHAGYKVVEMDDGEQAIGRCVLIATGASYRRLPVDNCANYEGRGVYYSATAVEAQLCVDQPVVVVGGGNSAGQAAVFLAERAGRVVLVCVEEELDELMSSYLATRIRKMDNVEVRSQSEVTAVHGDEQLEAVTIRSNQSGEEERLEAAALFIFIGAEPHTDWLPGAIEVDDSGFIKTGPELAEAPNWPLSRLPYYLETSQPGVFAAGDARAGSVKRVAAAVGEGSMAIHFVHQVLAG